MLINASDFAKNLHSEEEESYTFGVGSTEAALVLRRMADKIETNKIGLRSVKVESIATIDDFTTTTMHLEFIEKKPKAVMTSIPLDSTSVPQRVIRLTD